jgi:hypothetical protein
MFGAHHVPQLDQTIITAATIILMVIDATGRRVDHHDHYHILPPWVDFLWLLIVV